MVESYSNSVEVFERSSPDAETLLNVMLAVAVFLKVTKFSLILFFNL